METLASMLLDKFTRHGGAVSTHVQEGGIWRSATWGEVEARVASTAEALATLGVGTGERVAILGNPHPRWLECDFATLCLGGVTVGIYPTLTAEAVRYQLAHSGARLLVVESAAKLEELRPALEGLPIVARTWDFPHREVDREAFRARARLVKPEDACAIFYTSGTTGEPKGAVVTHGAMAAVCRATQAGVHVMPGDRSLLFLPLAHSLQRMVAYRGILEEVTAYFVPSLDRVADALPVARPSVIATVPRMLEKIKAGIEAHVAKESATKQRIFRWALGVGVEASRHIERKEDLPGLLAAKLRIADRLVFRKVRTRLGGELRLFAVGGARLDPEVARFFHALGITVCEAWGLTETCAPATLNTPEDFRFGTVGKPLPGVTVKLAEDGEILVKGPGLFKEYWRDPVATAAAFTDDGFFRTGDIGVIEDDYLKIVDRKKEILVTSGGKNIPPVNVEKRLEGGVVGQAVVIGDGRPYLVALLAPDPEHAHGLDAAALQAAGEARVREANAHLSPFEQVKQFAWLPKPLTPESGLLTPTLKLKRRVIAERYAEVIAELYAGR